MWGPISLGAQTWASSEVSQICNAIGGSEINFQARAPVALQICETSLEAQGWAPSEIGPHIEAESAEDVGVWWLNLT